MADRKTVKERIESMNLDELRLYAENEVSKRRQAEILLEDVFTAANKQSMALTEFIQDYDYDEKPDPYAALAHMRNEVEDAHSRESSTWFWEYDRIIWLINVAHDYGIQILKLEGQYKEQQKAAIEKTDVKTIAEQCRADIIYLANIIDDTEALRKIYTLAHLQYERLRGALQHE